MEKILNKKGYTSVDIIQEIITEVDQKTREFFDVENYPVHLWEKYYIGDADENELTQLAVSRNLESYQELLEEMDIYLEDLLNKYPMNHF